MDFKLQGAEWGKMSLLSPQRCFHFREAVITVVNNQTEHQRPDWCGATALCGPAKTTRLLLLPERSRFDSVESCGAITDISLNNTRSVGQLWCTVLVFAYNTTTATVLYWFCLGLHKKYNNIDYVICVPSAVVDNVYHHLLFFIYTINPFARGVIGLWIWKLLPSLCLAVLLVNEP